LIAKKAYLTGGDDVVYQILQEFYLFIYQSVTNIKVITCSLESHLFWKFDFLYFVKSLKILDFLS